MFKVIFLGVGEAFDENNPNNSSLVISETKLLLDCGLTTPYQLWKYNSDKDFLDGVYITHLHADHYFGLAVLLVRLWEEKRTKPFTILCQKGAKKIILKVLEYAYKGFLEKFNYKIKFIEIVPKEKLKLNELILEFASTNHSRENLAIKISKDNKSICYSGDGMFNEQTEKLYENSDLVIQETYLYNQNIFGHASIIKTIEMAKRKNIKALALTHLNRTFRKDSLQKTKEELKKENLKIMIPESLDEFCIA